MARVPQHGICAVQSYSQEVPQGLHCALPPTKSSRVLGCRNVDCFEKLNKIEEGTYGIVYRARDKLTGEIVALKKLKGDREKEGFPITSLREIKILLKLKHPNIVDVREVVFGDDNSVYIVMEFVDHDIRGLMIRMGRSFSISELKTLMYQLLDASNFLHENWVLHRDMKTTNLLYNNRGQLKIADFGLAREFEPKKAYTGTVVTLWYRAPEILLGQQKYTPAIDMWSIGCIFAELIMKYPLFPGKSELDQLDKIFEMLGTPNEYIWPEYKTLPATQNIKLKYYPFNNLRGHFARVPESTFDLLNKLLTYDPAKRISAREALQHPFFYEHPLPKHPSLMPSCPSPHNPLF